jgi:hypothetical protein
MKLIKVDREHIKLTVEWWQNHTYATHSDIGRVERFRELDANTATFEDVTAAYGSTGWAAHNPCVECGDVEKDHLLIGNVEVCTECLADAADIVWPKQDEPAKKPFYKFWK